MSAPAARASIPKYLYNHNPFYAISAVLMLYSIRAAYGTLEIGMIDCWMMMGVLAGYTLVLAAIGVWIVRWGTVWEDARSIFLLLLLLFLAVSISADDLFVNITAAADATVLMVCGFLFSTAVSEAVLWGAGIRLGLRYRLPYHLLLALFYVAPWWCSPALHPRSAEAADAMLFLFPVVGSVLLLGLFPAVRGGTQYAANNGTPWPWPVFPGIAFAVIAAAVGLRSYALSMTFGFMGPIWKDLPSGRAIVFDTIWGLYFLVPLGLAVLVLLLEIGFVTENRNFVRRIVRSAPLLLLFSLPWGGGPVFRRFLETFTQTLGSPVWLTTLLLIAYFGWAWLRGAPEAGMGGLTTAALLSVVGPRTVDFRSLMEPQAWPLLVIGSVLLARGVWMRSSRASTAAVLVSTLGVWLLLPRTALYEYRNTVCFHFLWAALLVLGLSFRDPFARGLRAVSAAMFPLATLFVLVGAAAAEISLAWRVPYVIVLGAVCLVIARRWRSPWYLYGFAGIALVAMYTSTAFGFRLAVEGLGRAAVTAFCWSLGMLLLAFLISAHKARWLPRRVLPWWRNGNGLSPAINHQDIRS